MPSANHENSDVAEVGLSFAQLLVSGDYKAAHGLLNALLQKELLPSDLKANYDQMTSYWTATANKVEVDFVNPADSEWPGKGEGDIGWAFVSIDSRHRDDGDCLESIAVRVVCEAGCNRIAQVVWGRP